MSEQVDFGAEQAVIGAAMNDPETARDYLEDERVSEALFSTDEHRTLWRFVVHYLDHGTGPLTRIALDAHLASHPDLIVGAVAPDRIMAAASNATGQPDAAGHANPEHARRLRDLAERRRASAELRTAHLELQRPDVDPQDVVNRLTLALSDGQLDRDPHLSADETDGVTMAEAIEQNIPQWEKRDHVRFVPTGVDALDKIIGGLSPGQLVCVAARPGMGKSVLGLMLSRQTVTSTTTHALHWTLEMSPRDLAERYVATTSAATLPALTKQDMGAWSRINWEAVLELPNQDASKRLRILAQGRGRTAHDIARFTRRYPARFGPLGLVVVDYVGLLETHDQRADERIKISVATRQLKLLAQEMNVPVVIISQLNRKGEERAGKRPILSDLRESGSLEQDSDIVILVHRPAYHNPDDRPGEADLIVEKNRSGPTGTAVVNFEGEHARFTKRAAQAPPPGTPNYYGGVPLPGEA